MKNNIFDIYFRFRGKKYKIVTYKPLWWVCYAGGTLVLAGGLYMLMVLAIVAGGVMA